ncbi:MAG: Ig-like domain-containing protein [Oscillospiraceae bacterium]|nr:Ig-like domain-containing protein [Oscillospiraceae bacterium]
MNKVICDVCGTAYPETANVCPICGSARVSSQGAAAETEEQETTARTYVKGGRFSKKNVRSRGARGRASESPRRAPDNEEKTSKGLVAVVVLLLIAIVAVVIYIGIQFFDLDLGMNSDPADSNSTGASESQVSTDAGQSDSTDAGVPCTKLQLSNPILEFLDVSDKWTLEVEVEPLDCTEEISFVSSDSAVVTVTKSGEKAGLVQPVGNGEATITVTCGSMSAECKVSCKLAGFTDPSQPSDPTKPSGPVTGEFNFEFNTKYTDPSSGKYDTTFDQKGYVWRAYKSSLTIDPTDITWISDNPEVCTVDEKGLVTMVGPGTTEVHAQYNGKTVSCIVRCTFKASDEGSSDSDDDTQTDNNQTKTYKINKTDVTIDVDEAFYLTLKDSDGKNVDVTWTANKEGYVKIEGNKITGAKATSDISKRHVVVSCTYEGETYSCVIYVK